MSKADPRSACSRNTCVLLGYAPASPTAPLRGAVWGAISIGVFAGIVFFCLLCAPTLNADRGNARIQLCQFSLDQGGSITRAIGLFRQQVGRYPTVLNELTRNIKQLPNWQGPYLDNSQLLDPWGEDFNYRCPGQEGHAYELWSSGPNKLSGDDDDIIGWQKAR